MSDATVGIVETGSPTTLVDNEQRTNDNGDTVKRQRVAVPMAETLLSLVRRPLSMLSLALEPATARVRVAIESAAVTITGVTTVTTCSTVTTCASVTNVAQIGGVAAGLDQYNSSKAAVAGLRSKITVT